MAPLRSMTGFGAANLLEDEVSVRVELRSVNHRYLQVSRLFQLAALESEAEALVREKLERGSVNVTIAVEAAVAPAVRLNRELARRYQGEIEALARELGLEQRLGVESLIALPGVLGTEDTPGLREREARLIQACLRQSLSALLEMREREGLALEKDLRANAAAIRDEAARIGLRMPLVVREHHKKLQQRVQELLGSQTKVAEADLARELALLADRMDVGEELTRLASHLGQWTTLLDKGGPIGRQLDFLVQEMLREANTIASKCNDAEVAHGVVEIKSRIERLREQVQNVE